MNLFRRLVCFVSGHRRNRFRLDEKRYTVWSGPCVNCGAPDFEKDMHGRLVAIGGVSVKNKIAQPTVPKWLRRL